MKKRVQIESGKDKFQMVEIIAQKVNDNRQKNWTPGEYCIMDGERCVKQIVITGKTKTDQSFGEQLDINRLLEPAQRKGLLRHVTRFEGEYDDIPAGDYQEAQFIIAAGKSMFEALPSKTRFKFDNDPAKFMSFVQDPANKDWLISNGIAKGVDGLTKDGIDTGYNPNPPSEASGEAPTTPTE